MGSKLKKIGNTQQEEDEPDSDPEDEIPSEKIQPKKSKWSFFGLGNSKDKKDEVKRKTSSSESKSLPKNFAAKVLDLELKIDSGQFTIKDIDAIMSLYSTAVEYYSGMNDEKYVYFAERIQNTLLKPEILKLMKINNKGKFSRARKSGLRDPSPEAPQLSSDEKQAKKKEDQEIRKKERIEKLG